MKTIENAFSNNPMLAALTVLMFGVCTALVAVGVIVPALWITMINILLGYLVFVGIAYLVISRAYGQSSVQDFTMPRLLVGIQITFSPHRHTQMIFAM